MSDKPEIPQEPKEEPNAPELPELPELPIMTIQMTEDGGVIVNGPIRQKGLCYGMLEQAKDAIHEYHLEKKYRMQKIVDIITSNGHDKSRIINFLRGGKK